MEINLVEVERSPSVKNQIMAHITYHFYCYILKPIGHVKETLEGLQEENAKSYL